MEEVPILMRLGKNVRQMQRTTMGKQMSPTGTPSRLLSAAILSTLLASGAFAQQRAFDLPEQEAVKSIPEFARQAGIQISAPTEQLKGIRTPRIQGELDVRAALQRLIEDTGLEVASDEGGMVILRKSFRSRLRLTQTDTPPASQGEGRSEQGAEPRSQNRVEVEEIIVTAQKRNERLQDVPVPVTVVGGETLVNSHQLRLEDYYTKVPGLNLALLGPEAAPTLSIRGLTLSGSTNPTVGIVVDDIPYGSTVTIGNALTMASIDPGEIERIEVLRGPQGTLYGANSLGGLLKYTTVDPSTERVSGRIQAGTISINEGDDLGYVVRSSLNLPLGDTFALRASAFTTRDPGYIDNVATGREDVNETDSEGGRVAALWRPSEDFSVKLSALLQDSTRNGALDVHRIAGLADLEQSALLNSGVYDRNSRVYSATIKARLGSSELTSATGYSTDETHRVRDDTTTAFGTIRAPAVFGPGVTGATNVLDRTVDKFSQEIRMEIPGEKLEWLFGAFYTREEADVSVDFRGANPTTGADVGSMLDIDTPQNKFEEYAAFADLTVHFTERFDVQFGGRVSENKQSFYTVRTGPLVPTFFRQPSPFVMPVSETKDSPFTYLVTPRLQVSPDLMMYARIASGYRPGAPNVNCGVVGVPCTVGADTTENYEIGVKGSAFSRLLTYDASVYSIDWVDVQIDVNQGGLGFIANAGRARSRGVELTIGAQPWDGMNLSAWVVWNDAELAENLPPGPSFGREGDALPNSGKWSGSFSADQDFQLSARTNAFIGATVSYVDDRLSIFRGVSGGGPLPRQVYPAYTQVDARAGIEYDTWTFSAFVNNATDKRALLGGGAGAFIPTAFNYSQPRTIGVSASKTF